MSRYVTLVWKKNKIVNVSIYAESCQITVFTNSAGFLIRCMRLFDAIREELVPYGTQTFPSVASASLCLIKRNLRRYLLNFVVHICSQADISMISIFFLSLLVNIPILILPSTPKWLTVRARFARSWDR